MAGATCCLRGPGGGRRPVPWGCCQVLGRVGEQLGKTSSVQGSRRGDHDTCSQRARPLNLSSLLPVPRHVSGEAGSARRCQARRAEGFLQARVPWRRNAGSLGLHCRPHRASPVGPTGGSTGAGLSSSGPPGLGTCFSPGQLGKLWLPEVCSLAPSLGVYRLASH